MKRDRNHEGYHDPTAGKAIRRASRRYNGVVKRDRFTYRLEEVMSFWMVCEMMGL